VSNADSEPREDPKGEGGEGKKEGLSQTLGLCDSGGKKKSHIAKEGGEEEMKKQRPKIRKIQTAQRGRGGEQGTPS